MFNLKDEINQSLRLAALLVASVLSVSADDIRDAIPFRLPSADQLVVPVLPNNPLNVADGRLPSSFVFIDLEGQLKAAVPDYMPEGGFEEPIAKALALGSFRSASVEKAPVSGFFWLQTSSFMILKQPYSEADTVELPLAYWAMDDRTSNLLTTFGGEGDSKWIKISLKLNNAGQVTMVRSKVIKSSFFKEIFGERYEALSFSPLIVNGEPTACELELYLMRNAGVSKHQRTKVENANAPIPKVPTGVQFKQSVTRSAGLNFDSNGNLRGAIALDGGPEILNWAILGALKDWTSIRNREYVHVAHEWTKAKFVFHPKAESAEIEGDFETIVFEAPRIKTFVDIRNPGAQGMVHTEYLLSPEGDVVDFIILESSHLQLSIAVESAIRQWKFEPARRNGDPVSTWVRQTVVF